MLILYYTYKDFPFIHTRWTKVGIFDYWCYLFTATLKHSLY